MKKWTLAALFGATLALGANAQQQEGERPANDPQRTAVQRLRLTRTLGVSEAAADSIMFINLAQREAKMNLARNRELDYSVKEAQFEALRNERRQRLLKVMSAAQVDALDKMEAEQRARRAERALN